MDEKILEKIDINAKMALGIDIGSTTIKFALIKDGELVFNCYERHFSQVREKCIDILKSIKDIIGDNRFTLAISGSAGLGVARESRLPFVQEVFEAQIQSYYYKLHNIEYTTMTIDYINGSYELVECLDNYDLDFKNKMKKLINVYEGDLNVNYLPKKNHKERERTYLSSSWFKKRDKVSMKEKSILKNNMDNYFRNICNAKADNRLWTTYKSSQDDLKGKRYSKQFLSYTTRATNQYKHIENMAFMLNLFMNPNEVNYFIGQNVKINEELLAISDMLQWIFRSSIRDNKPINIYIPSLRMRNLLSNWLNNNL